MVPFSVLDLAPVVEGGDAARALRCSLDLARHAERWGYRRYWFAEHHGMPGVASAATAVVIGHVAAGTSTLRVGAGGIMLPNHAPLVVAEQFGTLESLFPGRIDLGLGRAPGTDPLTSRALRRTLDSDADAFPEDVLELMEYFKPAEGRRVLAVPGAGLSVPIWILGSSLFGARLAAALGLPYAFASHFAPAQLMAALEIYRAEFRPSPQLAKPYAMAGVNVVAADTDEEAAVLATSHQQAFVNLRSGRPGRLPPPKPGLSWGAQERAMLSQVLTCSAVGSPRTVQKWLGGFLAETRADEVIIAGQIYDHAARLRSYELAADALRGLQ
ncbi:MAG TPA: LLM class flavin-dependent oxidoreductase [Myxococcales bacterium]|nr:LLM class flavin-dependent oxidoreductase [Myxococcales bacterium]